jgi:hypothetical protein
MASKNIAKKRNTSKSSNANKKSVARKKRSKPICFVIAPIGELDSDTRIRSDKVLEFIIKPAASKCGYKVIRADQISEPGLITSQVTQHILNDPLVIADLTDYNPNVFYELAIRHAAGKPCIHLIGKAQSLPFDIYDIRAIKIDLDVREVERAKKDIIDQIGAIKARKGVISTPLSNAIDLQSLQQSESPESRALVSLMATVSELRSGFTKVDERTLQVLDAFRSEIGIGDSIYALRSGHYKKEKEFLAEPFIKDALSQRVLHLTKVLKKRVRIVFDSGSTIAPMFNVLGREAESDLKHWCRSEEVQIVTNNIRGIVNVLQYRDNRANKYAQLPIRSLSVLPGQVLASFEAIADEATLNELESYRKGRIQKGDIYTIGVTTGNYLLLHQGKLAEIARAGWHPDFKATLIDIADEVYVVAPLGKILVWTGRRNTLRKIDSVKELLEHLNHDLKFEVKDPHGFSPDMAYDLVTDALTSSRKPKGRYADTNLSRWLRKTILVTTARSYQCLFHAHSVQVKAQLAAEPFKPDLDLNNGPYLWQPLFNALPISPYEQFKVEVPHENLQEFAENYFFLFEGFMWSIKEDATKIQTERLAKLQ